MNERILISGAGIAGLTLAYWLARHGLRPTIVERAPELRTGGNGVDVRDDAVTVAERMGLMNRIRELATDVNGMKFVDAADRAVARISIRETASVEIMRGDLVALLREAADDVEIRFGDSIRALKQDAHGVTVAFERAPVRRFDLVIGADGMHSNLRRLAFGPEERFVRHKDHYFAFANADGRLGEDRWVTMFNTPGKMTGIYRSGTHTQAKAYFIFRSERLNCDHRDIAEHKRLVAEAFADQPWQPTRGLLEAALADPDFYFDALGQVRMDSWSNGRTALIGDAAWCASPASGAGAELALVGAYRLAGELAAAGGDHRVAFARYDAVHRPLVDRKQQIGPNLRLMVPRTEGGRRVRDALVRLPLMKAVGGIERRLQFRAAETLPVYRRAA
ncbi:MULTISPECIES: FAD-dependent monooxygenase [unclassified Streptomyces]|uniref:FAD-dependent monooxygenase n=1 Tax=unclassified Streptomyces TaxID=2593676 RepID=UPI0022572E2F|nr:FAD-dependent monooxygenase [Streptomyces sp. NBC_00320]MCX5151014.1 FAD-dependent monooxygenase [Streptomyces sp. NBC_00320]WSW63324.1 FAD-dependent monooxygenase [Streptomyces sp. NBC_00998]